MRGTLCGGLLLLAASSAFAEPNADLDKAQSLLDELNYKQAQTALDAAWKHPGNDRQQVLRILELQGVVAATLNQGPKATQYFSQLLALDVSHKIAGDWPPRVMTPFYEAKGRIGDKGGVELKQAKAASSNGKVIQVGADVNDPTKLSKKVRFHVRNDGGGWTASTVDAQKHPAASADGVKVEWWAELLNEYDGVLANLGELSAPLVDGQAPVQTAAPVAEVVPPPPPPPVEVEKHESLSWSSGRWAGVAVGAAGVIAIGAGVFEGLQASSLQNQVNQATKDGAGHVTSVTQAKAYSLDSQQRTAATVANVCLVGGGVAAAAGVALVIFSGPSDTKVTLAPAGAGFALSGSF
jgi:hypothetical protein